MRVFFISPVFELAGDPGSDRYHFFYKYLASRGHDVVVMTSAVIYKTAQIRSECRGRWRTKVMKDEIEINYLWSFPSFHGSFLRRMVYLLSYMLVTLWLGLWIKRPDIIHTVNTPGMVGQVAYWLSRLRKVPLVFDVADVWPDAAIAMGMLTNPWVIKFAQNMEDACYNQAVTIVALTQGIKDNIENKGIPAEKIKLITNGIDPAIFEDIDHTQSQAIRTQ